MTLTDFEPLKTDTMNKMLTSDKFVKTAIVILMCAWVIGAVYTITIA